MYSNDVLVEWEFEMFIQTLESLVKLFTTIQLTWFPSSRLTMSGSVRVATTAVPTSGCALLRMSSANSSTLVTFIRKRSMLSQLESVCPDSSLLSRTANSIRYDLTLS